MLSTTGSSKNAAFTLVEILVIIAIIALLASSVLATLNQSREQSRDVAANEEARQYRTALALYYEDHQSYPAIDNIAEGDAVCIGENARCGNLSSSDQSWESDASHTEKLNEYLSGDPALSQETTADGDVWRGAWYTCKEKDGSGCRKAELHWILSHTDKQSCADADMRQDLGETGARCVLVLGGSADRQLSDYPQDSDSRDDDTRDDNKRDDNKNKLSLGGLIDACKNDNLSTLKRKLSSKTRGVVADTINEATLPSSGSPHPLPLIGHWNNSKNRDDLYPLCQFAFIGKDYPLIPWLSMPRPWANNTDPHNSDKALELSKQLGVPVSFRGTQWERIFYDTDEFLTLPPEKNPNLWDDESGKIKSKVSPFGPIKRWREAGRKWASTETVKQYQKQYPNPPLVIFLSNNEASRLEWHEVEKSRRYVNEHGKGRSDEFKKQKVAEGWEERYQALFDGMRDGLTNQNWINNVRFVAYTATLPRSAGRWNGWQEYSLSTDNRLSPKVAMWDGSSFPYYLHQWNEDSDYTVRSQQIQSMNAVAFKRYALDQNPPYWFEMSPYDGRGYDANNQQFDTSKHEELSEPGPFTPDRYGAYVKYGMWLMRPRLVRSFGHGHFKNEQLDPFLQATMDAVKSVHNDSTLTEFWRYGELVSNPNGSHPYTNNLTDSVRKAERWYLLDADENPERPWGQLTQELDVFALARVIGEEPDRRWLLYAHAPGASDGPIEDTTITVPGYGEVTADVSRSGAYWLLREGQDPVQISQ